MKEGFKRLASYGPCASQRGGRQELEGVLMLPKSMRCPTVGPTPTPPLKGRGVIILGLDPGLGTTGWGLIRGRGQPPVPPRQRPAQDRRGANACPSASRTSPASSRRCIAEHAPEAAAVEEVFVNKNPQSTLKLGQARGVVLMLAAALGLDGRRICRAAGQESGGRHRQCRKGAGPRDGRSGCFPASTIAGPDAADALAVAITHAHHLATPHPICLERALA